MNRGDAPDEEVEANLVTHSAAVLSATTEQLALVAALRQRADDARTPRLGMPAVLLDHESEVLPDELRTCDQF